MSLETNKEILSRLDSKIDSIVKKQAEMSLEIALKMSNLENKQDMRFLSIEKYLKSDPETMQEGAIEKLDRIEKVVQGLKTSNKVQAATYASLATSFGFALKWVIGKVF